MSVAREQRKKKNGGGPLKKTVRSGEGPPSSKAILSLPFIKKEKRRSSRKKGIGPIEKSRVLWERTRNAECPQTLWEWVLVAITRRGRERGDTYLSPEKKGSEKNPGKEERRSSGKSPGGGVGNL